MDERIVTNHELEADTFEKTIRPDSFDEYIGQSDVKENIKVFVKAAKLRSTNLDHVLLYGPPGLGKTTLAHIISNELGSNIKTASGPTIEKSGDLAAILSTLEPNDVLFIDEIHRIPKLEFYSVEELKEIVNRTSRVLELSINDEASREIAIRSRKTPRIANRILKRVSDFALVEGEGAITLKIVKSALKRLKIDECGLDNTDIEYLMSIINKFNGGPVGIESISSSIGEESTTIEDVIEPFLLQEGFVKRTSRGRIITEKTYKYFKINNQTTLFDFNYDNVIDENNIE